MNSGKTIQSPPQPEKRKKYLGQHVALVENTTDPLKQMRAQVRVHGLFTGTVDTLPWAEYLLPIGARPNEGNFTPAQVGDYVWVDFPYDGDTRRPRIVGSVHFCPGGVPNLPHEAWDGPDQIEHKRTGGEPVPEDAEKYHSNCVYSQHGIVIEIVKPSEEGNGGIRITHKSSGSALEISPEGGSIVIHSENAVYLSSNGNLEAVIGGDAEIEAGGDVKIETSGDVTVEAGGQLVAKGSMVNLN